MPFNASQFYDSPAAQVLAVYTDVIGVFFYVIFLFFCMGYVLVKTESWPMASVIGLFIALAFSVWLPAYAILIFIVVAVFSFAAVIIDIYVL